MTILNKTKPTITGGVSTIMTIAIIISASITTAHANNTADNDHDRNDIGYIGVKTGMLSVISDDNASSVDSPTQFGGIVGYNLSELFGVEVDYSVTTDADVSSKYNGSGQYKVANYGIYMTYNYPFSEGFYAKSKLGVAGAEVDETYFSTDVSDNSVKMKVSSDDVGLAGGVGMGYEVGYDLSIEGELNFLRSDNIDTNALAIVMKYSF